MSGHSEDRELEEYLKGDSAVSRRYRELPGDDVPSALDRSILAQAREAVQHSAVQPQTDDLARVRSRQRRLMKWALPTTLAACALLGVSVVMRSQLPHAPVTSKAIVQAEQPPAPAAAARVEDSKAAPASDNLVLIAPPRNAVTEFSELATSRDAHAAREREEAKRRESRRDAQPTQAARMEAASQRQMAMSPPPPPREERAAGQIAPAAPAPLPAPVAKTAMQMPQSSAIESSVRDVTNTNEEHHMQASVQRGVADDSDNAMKQQLESMARPPEEWLEEIRKLRRTGETREADVQWSEFRKLYPDYEVAIGDLARGEARN